MSARNPIEVIDEEDDAPPCIVIDDSDNDANPITSLRRNNRICQADREQAAPNKQYAVAGRDSSQSGQRQSRHQTTQIRSPPSNRTREQVGSQPREFHWSHHAGTAISQPVSFSSQPALASEKHSDYHENPQLMTATRPLEMRRKARCTVCVSNEVVCNGRKPCERCAMFGFNCLYPSAAASPLPKKVTLQPRSNPDDETQTPIGLHQAFETHLPVEQTSISQQVSNSVGTTTTSADKPLDRSLSFQTADSEIVLSSEGPQGVAKTVSLVQKLLQSQREYWLQGELLSAKIKAQHTLNSPSRTLKENPFRRLLADMTTGCAKPEATGHTTLSMKVANKTPKTIQVPFRDLQMNRELPLLPKYRSMGRMGNTFVAKNSYILKVDPYFVEDESDLKFKAERDDALKTRYRNPNLGDDDKVFNETLVKQRTCLERVYHWLQAFLDLLRLYQVSPDHLRAHMQRHYKSAKCPSCGIRFDHVESREWHAWVAEEQENACELLVESLESKIGSSLWHFIEYCEEALEPHHSSPDSGSEPDSRLCAICLVPNCLTHGAYEDEDEYVYVDDRSRPKTLLMNDAESNSNIKRPVLAPKLARPDYHICGLFCIGEDSDQIQLKEVFGINRDGTLDGIRNESCGINEHLGEFKPGSSRCGNDCAIYKDGRQGSLLDATEVLSELNSDEIRSLTAIMRAYPNNLRLPCHVAKRIGLSCHVALQCIVAAHREPPHSTHDPADQFTVPNEDQTKPKRRNQAIWDTRYSPWLDVRGPIVPCDHSGPCTVDQDCHCATGHLFCEWFCGCDNTCKRRFSGCSCKGTCFQDERCVCWKQNRECDPWLCHSCGVQEVLDPSNKYNEKIRQGRCRNCTSQLGIPAKTIKAESEVQGWGLYAGEDMAPNTFVGDYRGEIITHDEANRRGELYHNLGQEYLFTINNEQEIDGSNYGNKTRFMNNSRLDKYINVWSHKLVANGVVRVLFFTRRNVKAGEELLYDYNYPDEVQEHFWEKGDRQKKNGVIPIPKPRVSINVTREAESGSTQTPHAKGKKPVTPDATFTRKRKRRVVANSDDELDEYPTPNDIHKNERNSKEGQDQELPHWTKDTRDLASRKGTNQKAPVTQPSDDENQDSEDDAILLALAQEDDEEDDEYQGSDVEQAPLESDGTDDNDEPYGGVSNAGVVGRVRPSVGKGKRKLNPSTDKRFRHNNDRRGRRKTGR